MNTSINPSLLALLLLCLGLYSMQPVAAAIEAYADPRNLDEMESLRLTLRIEGVSDIGKPDTTPLDQDFEVLTSNTTSQYRSVNGKAQSWVELQLMLRPKRSGSITIPALTVGNETSQPISIQVNPLDATIKQAIDDMVFFETEVTPNPVYVQGETRFSRRLFYSTSGGVQMYSEMPGAPQIADAVVLPLGQTRSYSTQRDGLNYGVVEQRFAIIPERSGNLKIPSVAITSSIRLMKNGRVRRSGVRVSSEAVDLNVLPIPPEYPADQPWLAAADLRLVELWAPNPPVFTVGEPIIRHIEARVSGNVASAIPPLTTALDTSAFRQYPEPPELNDRTDLQSVEGSRSERFSILPTAPGAADIPGVSITWWDVNEKRVQITNLPAQPVQITGTAPVDSTAERTNPEGDTEQAAPLPPVADLSAPTAVSWQQILTWLAIVLAICALLGWWWRQRAALWGAATATLANQARQSTRSPTRRQSLKNLEQAAGGDPAVARQGLIQFAMDQRGLTSQEALRSLHQNPATHEVLAQLNANLYSAKQQPTSDMPGVKEILAAAQAFAKIKPRRTTNQLPALYPSR